MQEGALSIHHQHTGLDKLFRYAGQLNFGEIQFKLDRTTGLKAIIAIHNLKRGPAIGGCRLIHYKNTDDALEDALRLAYMMSYKAAIAHLPHGGAKAVLMAPKVIKDRKAYMEVFGEFVHELGGRYITAVDSGTSPADMDIIATRTPYVTCTSSAENNGDPAVATALGIRRAIEAAVKFKLKRDTLEGIHVAIQGAGHVGYHLAKELKSQNAHITMCDPNQSSLQRCIEDWGVNVCAPDAIYDVAADVFSPCALGAVLNHHTIRRLRVSIVAGSANNQLAHHHYAVLLKERGILYAPDFAISTGGLIFAAAMYDHADPVKAREKVNNIYSIITDIFEKAEEENCATTDIAEKIAIQMLQ